MKFKKFLAVVLSIAMVLSSMSFTVLAEDATSPVATYDELVAALANVEAEKTIELAADITIDRSITVPDGVILDLKDNTLYVNVENSYYDNVTIKNGNIVLGKDDVHVCDGYFLVQEGKTLVLNNVNISSSAEGIKGYAVFHLKTGANLNLIDSELDIRNNEYAAGYIVYAGESTASVAVTGTTVYGTNVNGIVHATTVIDESTFTIEDAVEHGINRSAVTIDDSTVTISGGTGRGITAQHGDLVILGSSVVNIFDMGEATIELRNDKSLTVADTADVTLDVAVNNTTSGTITGDVTVDGATEPPVVNANVKIGEKTYITLQDALADAKDGDTITLIWKEGNAPIAMNGYVSGKTVTITGTAEVDWEKGFLFVGRTTDDTEASDAKLIFENATLTTTAGGDHGIHVSGAEKGSATKANGTVEIKNSNINLTYLINKGAMSLDNSTLTVKSGFSIGGRPASETESGEDATATLDLTNNSKVVVDNHNGMGLGYEAIGIMNIDESSAFESIQNFLVTEKGTMNVNGGNVDVKGKLEVKGTLTSHGDIYGEITKASNDAVIEIYAGVYSYDPTAYVVNGLQAVYDDVTKLYTVIGTHTINIEAKPAECYGEQTVKVTVEVNGADFANAEWKLTYNKDVVKYVGYEDNTNGVDEVSPKVSEGIIEDKLYTHTAGDPFKGNTVLVTYEFETISQDFDDVKAVFTLSDAIVDTWYSSNFGDTEVDGDSAEVVVKRRDFENITISDTANGQTSDITNKIDAGVYEIPYDGFAHEFAVDTSAEDETINYVITKDGVAVTEILAKGTYEVEYTIEKTGYKPFNGSFKVVIGDPDFVLETSTYTLENYTLVMVYMNAEGMAPTFGGKQMYDITSSGYKYQANPTDEGTPYEFVYGIVIPEPEDSEDLTLKVAFNTADAIEIPSYDEDVNFVGGVTDRDAVVTINTYKGNKGQLEDYNLLSRVLKADVDKNKIVNMTDVTMVERAAAK